MANNKPFSFSVLPSTDRLSLSDELTRVKTTTPTLAQDTFKLIRGEKKEPVFEIPVEREQIERITRPKFDVGPTVRMSQKQAFEILGRLDAPPEIRREAQEIVAETVVGATAAAPQKVLSSYATRISKTAALVKAPIKQRIINTFNDIYTSVVDRFNPISRLVRKVPKPIPPGKNPNILARNYLGVKGKTEQSLFWKTTKTLQDGTLKETGSGLKQIINSVKKNLDDLDILLTAERDIELSQRGTIKGTFAKESKEAINALKAKYGDGYRVLTDAAQRTRDWARRAMLDPLVDVGVLSKKQYSLIRNSNEFYTPFNRVIEELEAVGTVGKSANLLRPSGVPIKKIMGSEKKIISPLENLITNNYKITDFVERTRVTNSIVNLRKLSPELAEIIKPVQPRIIPVATQEGKAIFRPSMFAPGKNVITSFEDGIKKFYEVPQDVAKLTENISSSDMGILRKILGFPARLLRGGATLSLEFIGRNPVRDQFSALVFSRYGYIPGIDLAKGLFEVIGNRTTYQKWLASGGTQSMLVSLDRLSTQKTLQEVANIAPLKTRAIQLFKNPLEVLRIMSEFMEKGTRVGEFAKALKKGATEAEAAFASREVTLDFARIGANTKFLNQIIAFWNANVQGVDKLARSFKSNPVSTSFKAVGGITLPSIGLYLLNRNNPRYQELPQWRKDLFWNFITPGPIISIPKPFELGIVFGTVPERLLQWVDKNDPRALEGILTEVGRGASPGFIPTILVPYLENKTNFSFFRDRPIVSQSVEGLPPELQANTYTSETAKEIGKFIKKSPAKIENAVLGYTAGLGRYVLETSDLILKKLGLVSVPPEPEGTLADIPGLRAFISREPLGPGSESVNRFFDVLDKARQAKDAVTFLASQGKKEEAIEFLKTHPEIDFAKGLEKIASDFSSMRKVVEEIRNAPNIDPQTKKKQIDNIYKLMTEEAKQVLTLINSIQE